MPAATGRPERVLIYRLGSLGDTIVALPALHLVQRAFPDAERWVLTNHSVSRKAAPMAEVLQGSGLVNGFIEYPTGLRDIRRLASLRARIRRLRPQALVYLAAPRGRLRAWRDAVFFLSCGIRRLIGVPFTEDLQLVRRLGEDLFEFEGSRLARCLVSLGDARPSQPASFDLTLADHELAAARSVLAPLAAYRRIMAVSVGAKVDVKDWGDERWGALLEAVRLRLPDVGVVMVGSADERSRGDALLRPWGGRALNLSGDISVRVSGAVLKRCSVFVGHDSGPMHLSAAVGTPCVAVFSSRNLPGQWFPQGDRHRVLYQPMPCQGCALDVCLERGKACIYSITVESVLSAVMELLERSPESSDTEDEVPRRPRVVGTEDHQRHPGS